MPLPRHHFASAVAARNGTQRAFPSPVALQLQRQKRLGLLLLVAGNRSTSEKLPPLPSFIFLVAERRKRRVERRRRGPRRRHRHASLG
ncbi:hypothetical protein ZWY2020_006066 [Hordeum vulgare]|nr:hypothetical protein ZWY2020_006066 [Hordeum vulgare]